MQVVALTFDMGECTGGHEWARLVMNADGHGWGTDGGRGWTRVLALVITALSGKKKRKKTTYLMNWSSTWLSVDARGGCSGR